MKYQRQLLPWLLCWMLVYGLSAQKQDYIWKLGAYTGNNLMGYTFDFTQRPAVMEPSDNRYEQSGHNASICDAEGNLLFYTNGCGVLDRLGRVMPNGDWIYDSLFVMNYNAQNCKFGIPGGQGIIALPYPGTRDSFMIIQQYYILESGNLKETQIRYHIVDMKKNDGYGDIVVDNVLVARDSNMMRSFLTAIQDNNKKDWWIYNPVAHTPNMVRLKLTENGLTRASDVSLDYEFTRRKSSSGGTAKFSPDGRRYALYSFYDGLHVYDFDRSTGELSNHQHIELYDQEYRERNVVFGSVEWSPNSRFIYTASRLEVHQIDTWSEDIQGEGIRVIGVYDGTRDPLANTFYLMAAAPDCKIYICSTSGNNSYHVIHNPDELGAGTNFCQSCLRLPQLGTFGNFPNFPRYRVDESEPCDPTLVSVYGEPEWVSDSWQLSPNPTLGESWVSFGVEQSGVIELWDTQGRLVYRRVLDQERSCRLELAEPGLYYVRYIDEQGRASAQKLSVVR